MLTCYSSSSNEARSVAAAQLREAVERLCEDVLRGLYASQQHHSPFRNNMVFEEFWKNRKSAGYKMLKNDRVG